MIVYIPIVLSLRPSPTPKAKICLATICVLLVILLHFPIIRQIYLYNQSESSAQHGIVFIDNSDFTYTYKLTQEEKDFPIAYSILAHNYPERTIRLLKSIFRPHNHYCIHIDQRAPDSYVEKLRIIAETLGKNIYFIPDDQRLQVNWGTLSVLKPEILCTQLLLDPKKKWKYWINLTGHEFPLRTNRELVAALSALNGTNIVQAINKQKNILRFPRSSYLPLNITWYKGGVHVAVRREFVDYMLNDPKAIELYKALELFELTESRMGFPDEAFFATLNHNPSVFPVPGAFLGVHEEDVAILMTRAKIWWYQGIPCSTNHWRRGICVFGVNDLPYLLNNPHFFANKFLPTVEPFAYDLLELWFANKIHYELAYDKLHPSFNLSYYKTHEYSWNHL